jgi:hypothetical protein
MNQLESDPYGLKEAILFRDHKDNPLINDFGMYVLSRLYTFQNMRDAFLVGADTDIAEYVHHCTELLDGSRVYRFSRELLAFLETMVAFSPYHVANDPFIAVPMSTTYDAALARYKQVPYDKLHEYITEGLVEWYERFKPDADAADDNEDEDEDGEEDDEVETASTAPIEALSSNLNRRKSAAPASRRAPGRQNLETSCPISGTIFTISEHSLTRYRIQR